MATKPKLRSILLFEDDVAIANDFQKMIKPFLGANFELKIFPLHEVPEGQGPYEDRLVAALKTKQYANMVLIVTDRDLSLSKWGGLSEAAVSRAAQICGVPVACYRQAKQTMEDIIARNPGDGRISLPDDRSSQARKAVILAKGFVELENLIKSKVGSAGRKKVAPNNQSTADTPGTLLAKILKEPAVGSHFDTYACGAQIAVGEILSLSGDGSSKPEKVHQALISALGVWLADLVMEYPGVLVDSTAAASYLDIDPRDFSRENVQAIFQPALYSDLPFADDQRPMWWRHKLDDVITESEALSGLEVCKKRGLKRIRYCPCSVDPLEHAGYYCMAKKQAISSKNSSGRVSWFPPGADLARITKETYRKLSPWIGS